MLKRIFFVSILVTMLSYSAFAGSECESDAGFMNDCGQYLSKSINDIMTCALASGNVGNACKSKLKSIMGHPKYDQCANLSAAGSDNPFEKCLGG